MATVKLAVDVAFAVRKLTGERKWGWAVKSQGLLLLTHFLQRDPDA